MSCPDSESANEWGRTVIATLCLPTGLWLLPAAAASSSHRSAVTSGAHAVAVWVQQFSISAHPAGVFVSSYLGGLLLSLGEWIIKKLPLVKHVYSAAKQVSAAVNPSNETAQSFRECVIIRHPRHGEFAFGFITGQTTLQVKRTSRANAGHGFFASLPCATSKLTLGQQAVCNLPLLHFLHCC